MPQLELFNRLLELAPPPAHPVDGCRSDEDWRAVEGALRTKLPTDYKKIINTYGSGDFCDVLYLLNPFDSREELNLLAQVGSEPELYGAMLESYNEVRFGAFPERCPFEIYPIPGGLLPLASDSCGRDLFWLTRGDADSWTIVRYDWRGGAICEHLKSPLVAFLVEWIEGEQKEVAEGSSSGEWLNPVFCPKGQVRDYG